MRLYSQGSRRLVATKTPAFAQFAFALPLAAFAFAVGTALLSVNTATFAGLSPRHAPRRRFLSMVYLCFFPCIYSAVQRVLLTVVLVSNVYSNVYITGFALRVELELSKVR